MASRFTVGFSERSKLTPRLVWFGLVAVLAFSMMPTGMSAKSTT